MKLTFLGTRGYIEAKTRRHRQHSALLVAYNGQQVMVDCGEDCSRWDGENFKIIMKSWPNDKPRIKTK